MNYCPRRQKTGHEGFAERPENYSDRCSLVRGFLVLKKEKRRKKKEKKKVATYIFVRLTAFTKILSSASARFLSVEKVPGCPDIYHARERPGPDTVVPYPSPI